MGFNCSCPTSYYHRETWLGRSLWRVWPSWEALKCTSGNMGADGVHPFSPPNTELLPSWLARLCCRYVSHAQHQNCTRYKDSLWERGVCLKKGLVRSVSVTVSLPCHFNLTQQLKSRFRPAVTQLGGFQQQLGKCLEQMLFVMQRTGKSILWKGAGLGF